MFLYTMLRATARKVHDDSADADAEQDNDTYYFNSYAHISIHETMLRVSTTTAYYCTHAYMYI
eukprot:2362-Heterococcus_DN1.PRE.1